MSSFISLFWSQLAFAQTADAGQQPPAYMSFVPIIVMLVVFYFLLIRPQVRKQKEHQNFVSSLKRGDSVVTSGGIYGTIEGITDTFVTLEVADGVRIRVLKTFISTPLNAEVKK